MPAFTTNVEIKECLLARLNVHVKVRAIRQDSRRLRIKIQSGLAHYIVEAVVGEEHARRLNFRLALPAPPFALCASYFKNVDEVRIEFIAKAKAHFARGEIHNPQSLVADGLPDKL